MKRAPTPLDLVVTPERSYHQALTGATRSGLGGNPGSGFGVQAAAGGTGSGSATTPVTRLPPPAARRPSSGIGRAGGATGDGYPSTPPLRTAPPRPRDEARFELGRRIASGLAAVHERR